MHYLDVLDDTTATITSLEIVALINASRSEDQPVLLHKNFLAKVPRVLGPETSAKFLAHINVAGPRGGFRQSPIYSLPQREACLMAMSYSYELQARVYDRMVELEAAIQKPAVAFTPESYLESVEQLLISLGGDRSLKLH